MKERFILVMKENPDQLKRFSSYVFSRDVCKRMHTLFYEVVHCLKSELDQYCCVIVFGEHLVVKEKKKILYACLLYTSDAADE